MSKSTKLLSLCVGLLMAIAPGFAQAQVSTITVANGSATDDYVPIYGWYMDAAQHSQFFYHDTMLTAVRGNYISSMVFYSSSSGYTYPSTMTVSLGIKSDNSFGSDFDTTTTLTTVWTGQLTIASDGTMEVFFDVPYLYPTTGGNLMVEFIQTSGANYSSASFNGMSYTGNGIRNYYDYAPTVQDFLPKCTFSYSSSMPCMRPLNLAGGAVSSDSCFVSWLSAGSGVSYNVYVSDSALTDFSNLTPETTTDTFFYADNLQSGTMYYVYVQSDCGNGSTSSVVGPVVFTTPCSALAQVPYTTGFEGIPTGMLPYCWIAQSQGSSGAGTFPAAYVWAPNALTDSTYLEFESSTGEEELLTLATFDNSSPLQMSFYITAYSSYYIPETFEVGYMSNGSFVAIDTLELATGAYPDDPVVVYYSSVTTPTLTPAMRANGYGYASYYGYTIFIDDLSVTEVPSCPPVTSVSGSSPVSDSLTITWNENGTATNWNVVVSDTAVTDFDEWDITTTSDNPYLVGDLMSNTVYHIYVQADCGGETSPWAHGTIRTACSEANPVPMFEGFEDYTYDYNNTQIPFCWNSVGTYYDYPYVDSYGPHTGNNSLYFYHYNQYADTGYQTIILPSFDTLSNLQMSFYGFADSWSTPDLVEVGIIDTNDAFVPWEVVNLPVGDFGVSPIIVSFAGYEGEGHRPAIRMTVYGLYESGSMYIDDVNISYIPECSVVQHITVDTVSHEMVTLSWDANDMASGWNVVYTDHSFNTPDSTCTSINVTTNSLTVTGLDGNTPYYFHITTLCNDDSSDYTAYTMRTECYPFQSIPYTTSFETDENYATPFCWYNPTTNEYPYVYDYYSHTGTNSLYFYMSTYDSPENIIALPRMQGLDTLQMQFYVYASGYSMPDTFQVGVLEGNTFVPLTNVTVPADSYSATPVTVYFAGYTGTADRIAFRGTTSNYSNVYVDDITVSRAPDCLPISNITTTSDTTTEVVLSWNANGTTAWQLVYDTVPITNFGAYTPQTVATNPYTVTGLTAGTTYYFYIRSDCGTEQSDWTMGTGHTAVCDGGCYVTIDMVDSYGDGWNGNAVEVYQNNILLGSATIASGSSNSESILVCPGTPIEFNWVVGNFASECSFTITDAFDEEIYSADDCSSFYGTFTTYTTNCQPATCARPTDLTEAQAGVTSVTLTWTGNANSYIVHYYNDDTDVTLTTTTNSVSITGLDTLTAYHWTVQGICTDNDSSAVSREESFSTSICDNALGVLVGDDNMTTSTNYYVPVNNYYRYTLTEIIIDSAELGNITDINAVSFYYDYSSPSTEKIDVDIYLMHTTDSVFASSSDLHIVDTSATASNPAVLVYSGALNCEQGWNLFGFSTPFTWDGHSNLMVIIDDNSGEYDGSSYKFRARDCNGNKTLNWYSDSYNPDPTSTTYNGSMFVRADRPEMKLVSCGAGCGIPSVSVTSNDYQSATIAWSGSAEQYEVAVKAAGETTWPAATSVSNLNTYTFNALQPATQYTARVRAICDADEDIVSDWGMVTFTTDSLPCFAPTEIEVDAQGQQAVVSWTAGGNETQWTIHVFNTTFDQEYTANTNPYTVTGLTANVTYNVAVRANCGNGLVYSDWSDTVSFTTVPCDPVTNVQVSGITTTSANVSWTAGDNNTGSWKVDWNYHGASVGSTGSVTVNTTSAQLTGLTAGAEYDVSVSAICAAGYESNYTTQTFTTTVGIASVEDGMNLSIYPNPATGNTTITLSGVNGNVTLSVIDMSGRTVKTTTMECSGDCQQVIDVDNLAAGAYFVRVYGDNVNTVKKLIVK